MSSGPEDFPCKTIAVIMHVFLCCHCAGLEIVPDSAPVKQTGGGKKPVVYIYLSTQRNEKRNNEGFIIIFNNSYCVVKAYVYYVLDFIIIS